MQIIRFYPRGRDLQPACSRGDAGRAVERVAFHSMNDFWLRDEQLAREYWQAALGGPYPGGAREGFTKIEPSLDSEMRPSRAADGTMTGRA